MSLKEYLFPKVTIQHISNLIENLENAEGAILSNSEDLISIKEFSQHVLEDLIEIRNFSQKEYKKDYLNQLNRTIERNEFQNIGLNLIQNRNIDRPISSSPIVEEIGFDYLENIKKRILNTSGFQNILNNLEIYYKKAMETRIQKEIASVPIEVDDLLISKYRKKYYQKPLSFKEFLDFEQQFNESSSQKSIRNEFEKALQKKKLEEKKEAQLNSFDNYNSYFEMSERDLNRARRAGKSSRRKFEKKSRRRDFK